MNQFVRIKNIMLKLTSLNGAREALPEMHGLLPYRIDTVYCTACKEEITTGNCSHNKAIESIHLEVDVEAMASLISSEQFGEAKIIATTIALNIPQWARLVRK